jgi:hypothetical protein
LVTAERQNTKVGLVDDKFTDLRSARKGLIHHSCDCYAMFVVLVLVRRCKCWCIITGRYRLLALHTATVIVKRKMKLTKGGQYQQWYLAMKAS